MKAISKFVKLEITVKCVLCHERLCKVPIEDGAQLAATVAADHVANSHPDKLAAIIAAASLDLMGEPSE